MPDADDTEPPPSGNITARVVTPGVLFCEIRTAAYFMVGEHWRDQLTGRNARKWGRIYIDPSKTEKKLRRRGNLADWRGMYKGNQAVNCDECPGAMFMWDGKEFDSHVEPLCAVSNQAFGSDLYWALYRAIKTAMIKDGKWAGRRASFMGWWQVKFGFIG